MSVASPHGLEVLRGKRLGHGFRRRAVDVRGNNAGPRLGEFLRIDFADPFAAAGDDDGAAGQIKALVHGDASMDQAWTHAAFGATPSRA
jgi:hypothetical protein